MNLFHSAAALLTAAVTAFSLSSCAGDSQKDYDFYIFNTKGENAEAMQAAVDAYEQQTGLTIKLFSLGSGTNSAETLRAEMSSRKKPAIFSVMNLSELAEWKAGGYLTDLSTVSDHAAFQELHDALPDGLRLTDGTGSYGIPYNVEGYGYIVDTQLLSDLFGQDHTDAFLEDCRLCSYEDFAAMVALLDDYIQTGTSQTITLNGNDYPLATEKTDLTRSLTGVFAVAGSEKWTYGDHLVNIALDAVFDSPAAAQQATVEDLQKLKGPLIAYAKALDLKTAHVAGDTASLPRSAEMIHSTTNGYDAAVQKFAQHKAVFLKQGNWVLTNLQKVSPQIADTLTFLPVKLPLTEADITVPDLTLAKMQRSIPVFVPNYYAINQKVSDEEQKMAMDFLVWLYRSDEGRRFITEEMAFIPYDAQPEQTTLSDSLSRSILRYMAQGDTLPNSYAGAPANWSGETLGLHLMEHYLTKAQWNESDYTAIADYAIDRWKEMAGLST